MRYYIGSEARLRRAVEDSAMSVFDGWSYEEVITPTVDYYALFEHGMGHTSVVIAEQRAHGLVCVQWRTPYSPELL